VHVVATAGHVDHGKSTLVRSLTGMEPDRWSEERRRGMTIDLGYAWTRLPTGEQLAFVDVPGHERFTTNMLAGVGPAPAVLLVVAADEGWSAQTGEHVAALDALGVRHALLAVTRSDLADPGPATADALARLRGTSLGTPEAVAVSGATGVGLDELRAALHRLVAGLPAPRPADRVRLWVDRAFTITGTGTVVTGTLQAGALAVGDRLELGGEVVTVRGLESLGEPHERVAAVARVAVALRGVPRTDVRRGRTLLTPGAWLPTTVVDVRTTSDPGELPRELVLHVGSVAAPVTVRAFDAGTARLTLAAALPLQVGDRGLLRDPGRKQVLAGITVLDPAPPALARRGAAGQRSAALAGATGAPSAAEEVARRGAVRRTTLQRIGVPADPPPAGAVAAADWFVAAPVWGDWVRRLTELAAGGTAAGRATGGVARAEAAELLGLPDPALLPVLVGAAGLTERQGILRPAGRGVELPPVLAARLAPVLERLVADPFDAPDADQLRTLGLGPRDLGAAAAAGAVLRLPGDIVVGADAAEAARDRLATIPAPFTVAEAKTALGVSRRVAIPLLEYLDHAGVTRRDADTRRTLRSNG
jgi:selenocysteine-specific elongation factor